MEKIKFNDYEDFLINQFKDDPKLGIEIVKSCIMDYRKSGDKKDFEYIILNLKRILKLKGYKCFEKVNLNENELKIFIENNKYYDINILNKILEALEIEEIF
jgi:hypothetical protein